MAAMPILRPGIAAALLLLCLGLGLVVRHVDRGYVELVERDLARAEILLKERAEDGDGRAAFVAGGIVAARRSSPDDFCAARSLWRKAGNAGVPEARSAYVGITFEINRNTETCAWAADSLTRLLGEAPRFAAEQRGFVERSPVCSRDPRTALLWFRAAELSGSAHAGDAVDVLLAETGLSRDNIEPEARSLLPAHPAEPNWQAILDSEPASACPVR